MSPHTVPRRPDCRTCGACCGPSEDQSLFVDVTARDVARLSRRYARMSTHHRGGMVSSSLALPTKRNHNGVVCVALRGTVGKRVSCAIYDRRPTACREAIKPGDRNCRALRRELGIER